MLGTVCWAFRICNPNDINMNILKMTAKCINHIQLRYWEMKGLKKLCLFTRELGVVFGWAWVERLNGRWMALPMGLRRFWEWIPVAWRRIKVLEPWA